MILVDADSVSVARPGRPLFSECSLTITSGDRIGLVGLNGTGKSTLMRVLAGIDEPESGTVRRGRGVRVKMLDQTAPLPPGTALDAVGGGWEAKAVLDRLGMSDRLDRMVDELSGGERKRVALAEALIDPAELLLLDEPTNHLDIDAIEWLEDRLAAHRGGLVLVTHDRHVLDRVTNRIVELDRGRAYVHEGGYQSYLDSRAEREDQAVRAESVRKNLARMELEWLRRGAPARRRKPRSRLAQAASVIDGRPEPKARRGELDLHIDTPRLGRQVVELHGVGGGSAGQLFHGLDLMLTDETRLGIVGPNGAGKSTLLDIIAGRRTPDEGQVVHGPTVRIGYYDQTGREMDLERRVRDVVAGSGEPDWRDAALLERFWFDGDAQWAPVGLLSGGERRRLQLLLVLHERPNVLLLDEPTNDLDIDTLRVLEDFVDDWPGALVVVSHDRAFLERTVDDVLVLDGRGGSSRHLSGYAGWLEARAAARSGGGPAPAPVFAAASSSTTSPEGGSRSVGAGAKRRSGPSIKADIRAAEREIGRLTTERDELVAEVSAPGADHRSLAESAVRLSEVEAALAAAEDRWIELHD